jgi:hypothetical protein
LKKATLLLLAFILPIILSSLLAHNIHAASSTQVDNIDHTITPIYGGLILINDTVRISPTLPNTTIESFSIGFPLKYKANLSYSMAYETGNSSKNLHLILDTGLGVIGYYGVTVEFSDEARSLLYNGHSYTFTTVFVLSDLIQTSTKTATNTTDYIFTAEFPVYPSLAQNATPCHVNVILPKDMEYSPGEFPFNSTQKEGRYYLNYTIALLPAFTEASANVSFSSKDKNAFTCFSMNKLDREITIDANGHVSSSEQYLLESRNSFIADKIKLELPVDASEVAAFDEQNGKLTTSLLVNQTSVYEISLSLVNNQSRSVRVIYTLSGENRLVKQDSQTYKLNLSLSENLQIMPKTFILKIIFPEGAMIQSFPQQAFTIHKDVFQDTLSLSLSNVTWLQNEQWSLTYSYTIFWASFRPTIWATTVALIGIIIAIAWQRPRAPAAVSIILVPRKTLNDFVESYEEKKSVLSELEQVRQNALKGRVSRREYKVRKMTLDNRLSTLSRRLTDLSQRITSGGAKYGEIMRQLEVAEIELDNIEADIKRVEVRFKGGEISAQTYRQLLENDLRRKEKAKTTIDGVLIRLKE